MNFLWCILSLFFLITNSLHSKNQFQGWIHLELGAGNYGPDGHTKASQKKTVLKKVSYVSEKDNYINELEERGRVDYLPEEQYGILFWTLDQLVERYGEKGIFHVNDLYEEYALFGVEKIQEYALSQGYLEVLIEPVVGDYQNIDARATLSKHGVKKYDSVHLKNPEVSFYHYGIDGDCFFASEESCQQTRDLLQKLANLSKTGLFLFIVYNEYFVPELERREYFEKEIFYLPTESWEPIPYVFPEGRVIGKEVGRVFHIQSSISLRPLTDKDIPVSSMTLMTASSGV